MLYVCGHGNNMVVRPCPAVTANPNGVICTIPDEQNYEYRSQTMCPRCERIIHNRWVLHEEAEHRFLHERGVCGCDVKFPNLRIRPLVITQSDDVQQNVVADTDSSPAAQPANWRPDESNAPQSTYNVPGQNRNDIHPAVAAQYGGTQTHTQANQRRGFNNSNNITAASGSRQTVTVNYPAATNSVTDGSAALHAGIPPLYREHTAADGSRLVSLRLPSLFAAEWLYDHRQLHRDGRCTCPVNFEPVPNTFAQDPPLTQQEAHILASHRQIMDHPESVTEADIARLRAETGIPELGRATTYTVIPGRASLPPPSMFPANLGPNVRALDANTVSFGPVGGPLPGPSVARNGRNNRGGRNGPAASNIIGHETTENRTTRRHTAYRSANNGNNNSGPSSYNTGFGLDGTSDPRPRRRVAARPGMGIPVGRAAPASTPEETEVTTSTNNNDVGDLAGRVAEQLGHQTEAGPEGEAEVGAVRSRSADDAEQNRLRAFFAGVGVELARAGSAPAAVVDGAPGIESVPAGAGEAAPAEQTQVYAGLPVGAGPEGSVSHMPSYEKCPVRRKAE